MSNLHIHRSTYSVKEILKEANKESKNVEYYCRKSQK